jgi:DNA-binding NtrC family response regulator
VSKFRVLLVDDEEELAATLVERLEYRDIAMDYATDGTGALQKLQESSYDVMVIDLKLPGMSGEELLNIINKSYPKLPVLLITGHGFAASRGYVKPDGAYDFLPKPLDISKLINKMHEAIHTNDPD